MSIKINSTACIGCRACVEICPGNLLVMKHEKAFIREVNKCWGCTACLKVCKHDAIQFYLEDDIGGYLQTRVSDKEIIWRFTKKSKSLEIKTNREDSNRF